MSKVSVEEIKNLRDETGLSIGQCRQALIDSEGDVDGAKKLLARKAKQVAEKKGSRDLGAGVISSYIHNNRQVGVMLELNSETDFVAKNEEFVELARNIAMHITATDPEDVESLLKEPYIKDPDVLIEELIENYIQKFGEKIVVARFTRYSIRV